jgi:hypothetical protein
LVRYTLVTRGGADYFGEGVEGTLTWDYNLEAVNQPLVIAVPGDCPAGILDVPLLPDAADLLQLPGFTSYTTPAGLEDTMTFYQEQVSASGGQPANPPTISEDTALFGFTLHDQPLLLIVSTSSGSTRVDIYRLDDPAELAVAAEVPDARGEAAETETASGECPAGAVPIPVLADAADMQTMPGLLFYMTSTSVTDVVAFYEEQVAALGGQVSSSLPASDSMAVLDVQQAGQVFSVMILSDGGSASVTITSGSGSLLVPASQCAASESAASPAPDVPSAVCTVSSGTDVNQRSGPGTDFELAGTLPNGVNAAVDGQATGADGFVWWRLGEGVWVRSDVVNEAGDCASVPTVQP